MPEEAPFVGAELHEIDFEILKILWFAQAEKRDGEVGLTVEQIRTELAKHDFPRSKAAIQRHLNELKERKPPLPALILVRKKPGKGRGDSPYVYRLDQDNIITWPSTAFMLQQLWLTKPVASVEQETFVERMLQLEVRNSSTNAVAGKDEIVRQLATATKWHYIAYFNKSVMHPGPRLELEYPYLKFVAAQLAN